MPLTRSRAGLTASLAALALVIAGCGSSDDSASPSSPQSSDGYPQRIVSLSPVSTEILYAVGAGEQVVAVDERSNYPEGAPVTPLSGYTPNLEAILGYEPDLVVLTDDNGDIVSGLENVGVEVLQLPAAENLEDTYEQIETVGEVTGNLGEAMEVTAGMHREIEEIVASVPDREDTLTYFHELDNTFYTVTDATYVGQIYSMLGLESIATGDTGYPQMSVEAILDADPDAIFLADGQCCGVTAESVAERAGWAELTAVRDGNVYVVDEDLSSRWSPRVVDFLREVAAIVTSMRTGVPAP